MPLPSDEKIVQLAKELLGQLDAMFGLHGLTPKPGRSRLAVAVD